MNFLTAKCIFTVYLPTLEGEAYLARTWSLANKSDETTSLHASTEKGIVKVL